MRWRMFTKNLKPKTEIKTRIIYFLTKAFRLSKCFPSSNYLRFSASSSLVVPFAFPLRPAGQSRVLSIEFELRNIYEIE